MKTFLKENTPSAPGTGLFGFDLEMGPETEEGNSGGIELLPIRLFNIRPATQKTDGFRLLLDTSSEIGSLSLTFGLLTSLTP